MVPELFCKNVPESLYGGIWVPYHPWLPDMYQIYYVQHVKAIFSAKPIWPDMTTDTLYVKTLPTPWLFKKKTGLTRA